MDQKPKFRITITIPYDSVFKPILKITKVINFYHCMVIQFHENEWVIQSEDPQNFFNLGYNLRQKLSEIL